MSILNFFSSWYQNSKSNFLFLKISVADRGWCVRRSLAVPELPPLLPAHPAPRKVRRVTRDLLPHLIAAVQRDYFGHLT